MAKMIRVYSCRDCRFFLPDESGEGEKGYYCYYPDGRVMIVKKASTIPNWCPLEDAPGGVYIWQEGDDEKLVEIFNKMFPYDPPMTLNEIRANRKIAPEEKGEKDG